MRLPALPDHTLVIGHTVTARHVFHGELLVVVDVICVEIDNSSCAAVSRPFFEHGRIDRNLATAIPLVSKSSFPRDTAVALIVAYVFFVVVVGTTELVYV